MVIFYYLLWAALCAWGGTWLTCYCDSHWWHFTQYLEPVINQIHIWGFSCRKVLFWVLFILFTCTGLHKFIGKALGFILGLLVILVVGTIVIAIGWSFLTWLSGTL